MAIYAQNSCTLSTVTDVQSIYTYHLLVPSTTVVTNNMAPKDATAGNPGNPPGASSITITYLGDDYVWTISEPGINIQTNDIGTLYYIECTLFSDNTFDWGPIMTSSSYEAAKQAFNKATIVSNLVGDSPQHFWWLTTGHSTGIPAGAYITYVSQESFKSNPDNQPNLLLQAEGISLRNGLTTKAQMTSTGLEVLEGGIKGGQAGSDGFIYLSTVDYPLREYQLTSDTVINDEKTYYILNEDKYVEVTEPDVSDIATYYEISQPGITINNYTPTKINNEISNSAWRQIVGSNFGIDSNGNLYANGANIKGTITADSLIINPDTKINDINGVVSNSAIQPDIDEAKKVATNYITETENTNEITVHTNETEGEENNTFLQINNNNISINTIKGAIAQYGENIRLGDLLTYLEITSSILEFFNNQKSMARFGYDEIFESYGVQAENVFIKGAGNALRLDNNVNGTYQGQYILETRANGHLSLKPGLVRTEEV